MRASTAFANSAGANIQLQNAKLALANATAKACRLLKADVLADVKLLSERDVTQTIDSGPRD